MNADGQVVWGCDVCPQTLICVFSAQLFTDRDMVLDALTGGHDNRLLKINDRETQLVSGINAWKVALIEGVES